MNYNIFKTDNDNSYLLSRYINHIIFVSNSFANYVKNKNTDLEDDNQSSYNAKFYNYLKEYGFFNEIDYHDKYKLEINEEDVKKSIANTMQITFEVTQACNLKCKYCGYGEFYDNYGHRENQFMSFEMAKSVLDYMTENLNSDYNQGYGSAIEINFYGGEPLLNFKLIKQIVEYSKTIGLKNNYFTYGMTTNALLLNKYYKFLVENRFNLLISLDGSKENNSYRLNHNGENTFHIVEKNVELIRSDYPEYYNEKVNFNAVLHDKNSVEELYNFFKEKYNKKPNFSELNSNGISPDKLNDFEKMFNTVYSSLEKSNNAKIIEHELFDKMPDVLGSLNFIKTYHNNTFLNYNELFIKNDNAKKVLTGTCMPFSRKIFTSTTGKILPCESVGQDFQLGYVDDNGVHLNFKDISEYYTHLFMKYYKLCMTCELKGECLECLISTNKRDKKVNCRYLANKQEFTDFGSFRINFLENNPEYINKLKEIVLK